MWGFHFLCFLSLLTHKGLNYNNHMNKLIKKFRTITVIIALVELILLGLFTFFWFYDTFDIKDIAHIEEYLFVGFIVILVFDILFAWFALASLGKKRQYNDTEVASIIGNNTQDAYNLNEVGLVVTDNDGVVLWTSSLFVDRHIDLIDTNIFESFPSLKELERTKSAKKVILEAKSKIYEVRYLPEPHMFVFKDCTEYTQLKAYSEDQAISLGVILIDNFNDVASDTDEVADAITEVKKAIRDYFRKYNVLLTQVKQDRYFIVCNFKALDEMEKEGFSILENVRAVQEKEDTPLTLSIGFSHGSESVFRLYSMAEDAINTALARGGDQAVVSQANKELKFFGGKSLAIESTSKVEVRSRIASLKKIISDSKMVYIMGHTDMDMDALGSCLGIKDICQYGIKDQDGNPVVIPAKIVYAPKRTEKKARLALTNTFSKETLEQITITPEQAVAQFTPSTLVVVVDVSVPKNTMAPKLLDLARKTVVIDHHRRGESFIERPSFTYINPSASSASEMITEMIFYSQANPRVYLDPAYATIMLSGIFMDSQYFKSKSVGKNTFEAAEILKGYGADNTLADEYLKDDYEEFALTNKILSTMKTQSYGVLYCVSDDKDVIERSALAKAANALLSLKDVHASFVIGRVSDNAIGISARSDGTVSVQLLMEKLGGGGHLQSAATAFPNPSVAGVKTVYDAEDKLLDCLNTYLDSSKAAGNGGNNA